MKSESWIEKSDGFLISHQVDLLSALNIWAVFALNLLVSVRRRLFDGLNFIDDSRTEINVARVIQISDICSKVKTENAGN